MLPIIIDPARLSYTLVGNGIATAKRHQHLTKAGIKDIAIFTDAPQEPMQHLAGQAQRRLPEKHEYGDMVYIADYDDKQSEILYNEAKSTGALVNVEDKKQWCDFHVPALVRRGDLLLTISTNAKSPRLARRIRQLLERMFPESWAQRIAEIGEQRETWKAEGNSFGELAALTDNLLEERGWMCKTCPANAAEAVAEKKHA